MTKKINKIFSFSKTLVLAIIIGIASLLGIKGGRYVANIDINNPVDLSEQKIVAEENNSSDCIIIKEEIENEDFSYVGCNSFF